MTKYECPICKKVEWSNGYYNETVGTHPRTCKHGDKIIIMVRK